MTTNSLRTKKSLIRLQVVFEKVPAEPETHLVFGERPSACTLTNATRLAVTIRMVWERGLQPVAYLMLHG